MLRRCAVLLVFFIIFGSFNGCTVAGKSQLPRGASPSDAALYSAAEKSGEFECKDGSSKIPYSRVNDDYCDCADGSDEPGTSACLHGTFYCQNKGDEVKIIKSMYVDDGVCDCCDGTDEGAGVCPDICLKTGQEALKALEQELKDAKIGLSKKSQLEKTAANTRKSWEKRIKQLEEMEGSKAQQKAAAEVKKKQSESKLERLKDSLKKIEDQIAKQEKPPEEKVSEDAPAEEEEVAAPTEEESVEPAQPESEEEESEEERAKRIASQWIPGQNHEDDDDLVQDAEDGDTYEAPVVDDEDILMEQPSEEQESESEIQTEEDASDQLGLLFTIKTWFQQQIARLTGKVDLQQKLQLANSKVEAAKKIFDSANSEFFSKQSDYNNLQDEKSKLEQKIAAEYGASDVYLPLSESCLETTVDKYQYQVCPFGDAYQIENGRKTRLGSWSGFEENDTVMNFANGDTCWQGPPRSIKVKLACGATDIFESVVEPSRCTYLASIKTPAFCSGDFIETLQKEISRKKDLISAATAKEEL